MYRSPANQTSLRWRPPIALIAALACTFFADRASHGQFQPRFPTAGVPAAPSAAPAGSVLVPLRNLPAAELQTRLERLVNRSLTTTVDASGQWQSFVVEASPGAAVTMNVNARMRQVRIDGPPQQVAAWRSVVEALDSPPAAAGQVTQLVATKPANHERVRRTLQVLQASASGTRPTDARVAMLQPPQQAQPNQPAQPGAQPRTQIAPGRPQTAIDAARLAEAAGGLLGPVQVEFVEGLDVIVIRGAEPDVRRVLEIIDQIEQLSEITAPAIEIVDLQHVGSVQMAALMNRLYAEVLAARLGTVSITPLGKPNALLLIGRTENVQMATELIQRLDQPVSPAARFEVFPLRHASAAEAKTLIDAYLRQDEEGEPQQDQPDADEPVTDVDEMPPLAPRAIVVADIRTNYLIVSASPRDLQEIAGLIARIDVPGAAAQLKVFTIRNGDATSLMNMLRTLFAVPAEGEAQQAGGGIAQGGIVRLQFSVDQRTNSIIAVGSADDLAVVEAILLRLDEGDVRERMTTVYRLRNAFAQDVALALNQWLQSERTVEAEAQITISPFEQIEREVIIVPESASNSLLVSATPRFYEEIQEIIEQLDERPPMVIIQVLIGEVRLNDTDEFGIEFGLQDSLLFDRSLLGDVQTITNSFSTPGTGVVTTTEEIISASAQPGFNFNNQPLGNNVGALGRAGNVAAQGLSNFSLNRVNSELGFGGFVFSASSSSVSVLLRALQENRRLEVLSRPQLMALDGQPGEIQVGQLVPRIVATNIDPFGGSTNSLTFERVGLILQLLPRISPDGLVVMQITAQKSEVGPEAEGIPISVSATGQVLRSPKIDITEARTTVSALSGQTVVLGGLLQTRKFDVHRRVPLIADIPLIGDLFRYDSVAEERRELLIILTPRIIYGKEDADLVKQIESSRMSWILGDVINLHGETGLRSRCDEWQDKDIEAIYPAHIPEEGILPLSEPNMMMMDGTMLGAPGCEPGVLMQPTFTEPATTAEPTPTQLPPIEQPMEDLPPPPNPPGVPTDPMARRNSPISAVPDRYALEQHQVQAASYVAPARLPETTGQGR